MAPAALPISSVEVLCPPPGHSFQPDPWLWARLVLRKEIQRFLEEGKRRASEAALRCLPCRCHTAPFPVLTCSESIASDWAPLLLYSLPPDFPKNQVWFSIFQGPEPILPNRPIQPVKPLGSPAPHTRTSAASPKTHSRLSAQASPTRTVEALGNVSVSFKIKRKKYTFRLKKMLTYSSVYPHHRKIEP